MEVFEDNDIAATTYMPMVNKTSIATNTDVITYRNVGTNTDISFSPTQDATFTQTDNLMEPNTAHSTSTASSEKDDSEMNKDNSETKLSTGKKCCYTECPTCGTLVIDIGRHLKYKHNQEQKSMDKSKFKRFESNVGSKGRVSAGNTRSFLTLDDPPPDLQWAYDTLSGSDLQTFKKYCYSCLKVESAESSAVLTNPELLEIYTTKLSQAEVGPSGVAQVMATIEKVTNRDQNPEFYAKCTQIKKRMLKNKRQKKDVIEIECNNVEENQPAPPKRRRILEFTDSEDNVEEQDNEDRPNFNDTTDDPDQQATAAPAKGRFTQEERDIVKNAFSDEDLLKDGKKISIKVIKEKKLNTMIQRSAKQIQDHLAARLNKLKKA